MTTATLQILAAIIVAFCCYTVHTQSIDQELTTPGKYGEGIVLKVVKFVESTVGSTKKLLERMALVETKFGSAARTYRDGYHGGIWQVEETVFLDTQDVKSHPGLLAAHQLIQNQFGIDWNKVKYVDLRKPLYSGIAARLYYRNKPAAIPTDLSDQAKYWKIYYNSVLSLGSSSVINFAKAVMFYDNTISAKEIAGCGDVEMGRRVFLRRGAQCHTIDKGDANKIGLNLNGICDRNIATCPGYAYTSGMKRYRGKVWNALNLYTFLQNPKKYVPGTKMVFAGIKKTSELFNLIAYLCSQ